MTRSSPRSSSIIASDRASVSLTAISSGVATATTPVNSRSAIVLRDRPSLTRDRSDPRDLRERPRRAQDPDAVTGGGSVDDDEVVRGRAARLALELGELPDLADAEQLAHPRGRHRERVEQPARAERVAERADLDLQVLLHRVLRVDRDREQVQAQARARGTAPPSRSNARCTRSWAASSATIVRRPWRAASIPSAIATVDLPTPPLPVTNTSRLSRTLGTGAEHTHRPAGKPAHPARRGGRRIPLAACEYRRV